MTIEESFEVYESSMNGDKIEIFDIKESMATFHQKQFLAQINHNIEYYGMTSDSLANSINISKFRMSCLLSGNAEFEPREIDLIKNRLYLK